jgi:hypothetical protein
LPKVPAVKSELLEASPGSQRSFLKVLVDKAGVTLLSWAIAKCSEPVTLRSNLVENALYLSILHDSQSDFTEDNHADFVAEIKASGVIGSCLVQFPLVWSIQWTAKKRLRGNWGVDA